MKIKIGRHVIHQAPHGHPNVSIGALLEEGGVGEKGEAGLCRCWIPSVLAQKKEERRVASKSRKVCYGQRGRRKRVTQSKVVRVRGEREAEYVRERQSVCEKIYYNGMNRCDEGGKERGETKQGRDV